MTILVRDDIKLGEKRRILWQEKQTILKEKELRIRQIVVAWPKLAS